MTAHPSPQLPSTMTLDPERVPELSVVIPVYNSESIFPELYRRLTNALKGVVEGYELVAVVDGCRDRSFAVIGAISRSDPRVKCIELSRNFGHQAAVTAGLVFATGKLVVIMDDDLEDPPEALPAFIAKAREGYDVVYGIRKKRKRTLLYRIAFAAFYRVLSRLTDVKIPVDSGDFCVMSRRIVDAVNAMPEKNRYLRGLRAWAGFDQTGLEYERGSRYASGSGYTLRKYLALALDAVYAFSYKPLVWVARMGCVVAVASFLYGARLVLSGRRPNAPGWATLFVSILFFSGVQLIAIGILGQYLARIYDELKRRPSYLVKRSVGFGKDDGNDALGD